MAQMPQSIVTSGCEIAIPKPHRNGSDMAAVSTSLREDAYIAIRDLSHELSRGKKHRVTMSEALLLAIQALRREHATEDSDTSSLSKQGMQVS